jgi:hypothetical protein
LLWLPIKVLRKLLATSFRILALFNDEPNINKPNKNMKTKIKSNSLQASLYGEISPRFQRELAAGQKP